MKKRSLFKRVITGIKLGWNTPTLPVNVTKFQLHPIIRVSRVLGGISILYLLSNKGLNYPILLLFLALFFAFLFFLYHTILSVMRIKHVYRVLKSDKLDVRNSPLDYIARASARIVLCAKGVCDQAQPIGVAMGILLGVDTALEKSDKDPIFGPLLGSALKRVLPDNEVKVKVSDLIRRPISEIDRNNQEIKDLEDLINKASNWASTDGEAKRDSGELISELNKHKSHLQKNSSDLQKEVSNLIKSGPFNKK